ncbi:MAG: SAM-dependent methyltransferase [Methylophaga sp.]|uniref:Pcmt-protein-L-isoaspartate o-methyltransferase, putative n=1 Tax=Methylophaga aminisulfidivorans MP TaxID=1026882 RepID=F5SUZ1_9GAMM|nr:MULTISPECIES: hypothetical protein [Methylophaga]EGL56051.1 pcmt - protein-L-isoaspartate o-methyltransferase, putative [Methylophaga aminisulfidivorans MP]MAX53144.1 SAM-dependent methyltransferase [Methylophaga sp.]|tara:strand:+ start:17505 stop:18185 length:681 start_codon:yes stop_codon:yes gene_type:complete
MIIKLFKWILPDALKKQLTNFRILASEYGQFKTIKNWDCVDSTDEKIPWYTYPSIEYLRNLDFSGKEILEFGSGNSSSFWASRARQVTSIEHDEEWYLKTKKKIMGNQKIIYRNKETYTDIPSGSYDVVIIDGIEREACAKKISSFLNKETNQGVMVILDNSDWYKNTAKYLRDEMNFIEIDFHGFGPINNYTWTTSIFLSRDFNFQPVANVQPVFSMSASIQHAD